MTAPVLTVDQASAKQCPLRQHLPCVVSSCMAWRTTAKGEGYCVLLVERKE